MALADRNYWVPLIQEQLRKLGVILLAPYRHASSPKAAAYHSPVLGRVRYLVDTLFS